MTLFLKNNLPNLLQFYKNKGLIEYENILCNLLICGKVDLLATTSMLVGGVGEWLKPVHC